MTKKNTEYWNDRNTARLIASEKIGLEGIKSLNLIYDEAIRKLDQQIRSIYDNYADKGIVDVSLLKKALDPQEKNNFIRAIKRNAKTLGLDVDKLLDERYLGRLSRLDAIRKQIQFETMAMAPREEALAKQTFTQVLSEDYSAFQSDLEHVGIQPAFNTLDRSTLNTILRSKWEGSNYSPRIWNNTGILADQLSSILGSAFLSGQSYQKTTKILKDAFNVKRYQAATLVRTESSYFHNQAELQSYIDDGILSYTLDVTLDGRTSAFCRGIDESKRYKTEEAVVGTNYPPFHPNERTVPRAVIGTEEQEKPEDRVERFEVLNDNAVKERWKEVMNKQMNPDAGLKHDYNAEMNNLTQTYKGAELVKNLNNLMERIPTDDPLRPALERVAKLNGWEGSAEKKEVQKMFEDAEWDFDNANLTNDQINFIANSNIKFDKNGLAEDGLTYGRYNPDDNTLSIEPERIRSGASVIKDPDLYENVIKHELGHAIDHYAPFIDPSKGVDLFSASKDFDSAIYKRTKEGYKTLSDDTLNVMKIRMASGLSDRRLSSEMMKLSPNQFKKHLTGSYVEVDGSEVQFTDDDQDYSSDPKELFAESYALYNTNKKYLKDNAPNIFKFIDSIKLKL